MRSFLLSLLPLTLALAGCQSSDAPPPPQELVGGPCSYEETPAVATVSDVDAEQVRFLINGEITPYSRRDLPDQFTYTPGARFNVVEKRIVEGACTPYILEIKGPAAAPRSSANRGAGYQFPDPALK